METDIQLYIFNLLSILSLLSLDLSESLLLGPAANAYTVQFSMHELASAALPVLEVCSAQSRYVIYILQWLVGLEEKDS